MYTFTSPSVGNRSQRGRGQVHPAKKTSKNTTKHIQIQKHTKKHKKHTQKNKKHQKTPKPKHKIKTVNKFC